MRQLHLPCILSALFISICCLLVGPVSSARAQGCVFRDPVLALVPDRQSTNVTDVWLEYTITIENQDDSCIAPTTFSLFPIVGLIDQLWEYTLSESLLTVAPGATASATLRVHVPQGIGDGSFPVQVYALDMDGVDPTHMPKDFIAFADVNQFSACLPQLPDVVFTPLYVITNDPARSGSYTVTIRNRDSNCENATTFTLRPEVSSGWSAALSKDSVTLSPGTSEDVSLSVTPAASSLDDIYSVILHAVDEDGAAPPHNGALGMALYVLDRVAPQSPGNVRSD